MKKKVYLWLAIALYTFLFFITPPLINSETGYPHYDPNSVTLSSEEAQLVRLINQYRASHGLPSIPVSKGLTYVAQAHVWDLQVNNPPNMHSWSNMGHWTAGNFDQNYHIMWDKPSELTNYPGYGYEDSAGGSGTMTAQMAIDLWKGSSAHNAVIIEQNNWGPWGALGVGIFGGYAVAWFGHETDPDGSPGQRTNNNQIYTDNQNNQQNQNNQNTSFNEDVFSVVNDYSNRCLDGTWDNFNGANVHQWTCHGRENQQWEIIPNDEGYYYIKLQSTGRCLDGTWDDVNGANVHTWDCHYRENQQWNILQQSDSTFLFQLRSTGRCLDGTWDNADGVNVHTWDCHGNENQVWSLQ